MIMKKNIPELYGSLVFNDRVMKSKLPRDVYKALLKTIESGRTEGAAFMMNRQ